MNYKVALWTLAGMYFAVCAVGGSSVGAIMTFFCGMQVQGAWK